MSPRTLFARVHRSRGVFKFAFDQRLVPQPFTSGNPLIGRRKKSLRRASNEAGPRMFTRAELLAILDALDGKPVKSMARKSLSRPIHNLGQ